MNSVMNRITPGFMAATREACPKTSPNWTLPNAQNMANPASRKPKSPIRLAIMAFLAAFEFAQEGRPSVSISNQKPISKNEHRPTPSHPTNSIK
jgi:hypothetical protein